jgi:3-phosphoglycerate kinase
LNNEVIHIEGFPTNEAILKTLGSQKNVVLLSENLRFFDGEEKNDQVFARKLASLADCYVNEAFAASHREHASIVGVPKFLPHAAGLRLEKEVEILERVLKKPKRPFVVIIGGAKIETKLSVIDNLSNIADTVLVGGKLPQEIRNTKVKNNVLVGKLTQNSKDLSSDSIEKFKEKIAKAKMIVWNGPMGIFEEKENEQGTREIAEAIAKSKSEKIVGGGETIWALKKYGLEGKIDWISSGGGAMLEFLSGKILPGITALE